MLRVHCSFLLVLCLGGLFSPSYAFAVQPADSDTIFTKYVLFEWEPDTSVSTYQIQIFETDENQNRPIANIFDRTHVTIAKDGLDFGKRYLWKHRTFYLNCDTSGWSQEYNFTIHALPDSIRNSFELGEDDFDLMQPGLTTTLIHKCPAIIDKNGEIIWHLPLYRKRRPEVFFMFELMETGNIISIVNSGLSVLNLKNEVLVEMRPRQALGMHHEIFQKPDGNILTLVVNFRWIQDGQDSVLWRADDIVEITPDARVVWRWSCWDHIDTVDHDVNYRRYTPPGGIYDWTHANACPLDPNENAIYLSLRNLSRIVKIDYPSGEIIWQMGRWARSGDVDFGHDLDISMQHAPEILDNGNILLYDNHYFPWLDPEYSRALILSVDPDREEPAQIEWEFRHEFSAKRGDVDMLENGNVLVNLGDSYHIYEVNPDGEVVWDLRSNLSGGNYRAQRIESLYPLVFTITGPADSSLVPIGDSFISFNINNEGEAGQTFRYRIFDSRGWFEEEYGIVEIGSGRRAILTALSSVPDDDLWNRVSIIAEPVVNHAEPDTLTLNVFPGESRYAGGIGKTPAAVRLLSSFPNPFNSQTTIEYQLDKGSFVELVVYNMQGREIKRLVSEYSQPGAHRISYMGETASGQKAPSGSHICVFETEYKTLSIPIHLAK